jgi:hypothetical protein
MKRSRTLRVACHLYSDDYFVQGILEAIPFMPLSVRKAFLTICRVQLVPTPTTRLYKKLKRDLTLSFSVQNRAREIYGPITNLIRILEDFTHMQSPILSGLFSMLIRCLPFNDIAEVKQALKDGIRKEIAAATEIHYPTALNWSCFLSPFPSVRSSSTLAQSFRLDPSLNEFIHDAFERSKDRLSRVRIYPEYSRKTLGEAASSNLRLFISSRPELADVLNTTHGLEIIYHRTGVELSGETEVRWSWKFNDLKPRVYYARGPDQYYKSRYVQPVFNILIDLLPVSHRRERYTTHTLELQRWLRLFIYDYACFTSALHEIRYFVRDLSEFYRDCMVTIVDTYLGPQAVSLGDLLEDFNTSCNCDPLFDMGSCEWDRTYVEEIMRHHAGMLGVAGNIASCTLLHALHLIALLGHLNCKVVGDDAIGATDMEDWEVKQGLENIGTVADEKVEEWQYEDSIENFEDHTWHYTKRPLSRLLDRVIVGHQVSFPPLAVLLRDFDSFHTAHEPEDDYTYAKGVCGSLLSLALQVQTFLPTEEESIILNRFLSECIRAARIDDLNRDYGWDLDCPRDCEELCDIDRMVDRKWDCIVTLPEEYDPTINRDEVLKNQLFASFMVPALRLARDLGYASCDSRMRTFLIREDPERYRRLLNKSPAKFMYDFVIDDSCPAWLFQLIQEETDSLHIATSDDGIASYMEFDDEDIDDTFY